MIKCYMVSLFGQGDAQIIFVNQSTWDWINNEGTAPPEEAFLRLVTTYLGEGITERPSEEDLEDVLVACLDWRGSSPDNDRALNADGDYGPGEYKSNTFFSMKTAMEFARKMNLEIVDSFEGYIY